MTRCLVLQLLLLCGLIRFFIFLANASRNRVLRMTRQLLVMYSYWSIDKSWGEDRHSWRGSPSRGGRCPGKSAGAAHRPGRAASLEREKHVQRLQAPREEQVGVFSDLHGYLAKSVFSSHWAPDPQMGLELRLWVLNPGVHLTLSLDGTKALSHTSNALLFSRCW